MRLSVCVGCLRPGCERQVTEASLEMVRKKVFSGFTVDSLSLPCGLCNSCRLLLYSSSYSESTFPKFDFDDLSKSMKRNPPSQLLCVCYICQAGRSKVFKRKKNKPGPKSVENQEVPTASKTVQVCSKCFQKVGRGIQHSCKRGDATDNLAKCAEAAGVSEQVASKVLSDISNTVDKPDDIKLKRKRGPPMSINVEPVAKKSRIVTHSDLDKISRQLNLSDIKSRENARALRTIFGRKSIQAGYAESLPKKAKTMELMLDVKMLEFSQKISKKARIENPALDPVLRFQKAVVYAKDLGDLVEYVQDKRGMKPEDTLVKIGMDTGGDFVKVTLNVIDIPKYNEEEIKKRSSYGDGISPKQAKDTSVKKLLIVAIVSKVQESYENVSRILQVLDLTTLGKFKIAADQKLINVLCGLQSHSCTHPCPWCIGSSPWTEEAPLRTIGMLKADYSGWLEAGSVLKKAKQFFNVTNFPLLIGYDNDFVIDLVPPPELHLLLRPFNTIWNHLSEKWKLIAGDGSDPALQFAKNMNLVRSAYHGGDFEGNQCKGFLRSLDKLNQVLPGELSPYLVCLQNLSKLVSGCYGKLLDRNYKTFIQDFSSSFAALHISETPSVHAVKKHILSFVERNGEQNGLGIFSEQASESVHYDWEESVWDQGYKVPETHPTYPTNLKRAAAKYNSRHLT